MSVDDFGSQAGSIILIESVKKGPMQINPEKNTSAFAGIKNFLLIAIFNIPLIFIRFL